MARMFSLYYHLFVRSVQDRSATQIITTQRDLLLECYWNIIGILIEYHWNIVVIIMDYMVHFNIVKTIFYLFFVIVHFLSLIVVFTVVLDVI